MYVPNQGYALFFFSLWILIVKQQFSPVLFSLNKKDMIQVQNIGLQQVSRRFILWGDYFTVSESEWWQQRQEHQHHHQPPAMSRLYWKFLLQSNGHNLLMILLIFHHSSEQKVVFLGWQFTAFTIAWWKTSLRLSWVVAEQSIYVIRLNFSTSFSASLLVTCFILEKGKSSHFSLSWSRNGPWVCGEMPCILLEICLSSNKNDLCLLIISSYLGDPFCLPQICHNKNIGKKKL